MPRPRPARHLPHPRFGHDPRLTITVVPDSGTDGLAGLGGTMAIDIAPEGKHSYRFDYTLND